MKHFFANLVAMFFIFPELRRRVRAKITKIMNIKKINQEKNNYLYLKQRWLEHNNNVAPLPSTTNEYDLVFCIGPTCHGTTALKRFDLRRFSNPFDYTAGMYPDDYLCSPNICRDSRFREKIQAISNNFKDWLNPKYFKYQSRFINSKYDVHHHIVNTKIKIQYIHEFPVGEDILQHMPEFINKMHRRINNLYNAINKSNTILIVWISQIWDQKTLLDQNVSIKDIKWAVKQMHLLYPNKKFDFAFFEHDGSKNRFEYEKIEIAQNAFRIKSNHFLTDYEYEFAHNKFLNWGPHVHVISEMLDNIHLSKNSFNLSNKIDEDPF